MVEKDKGMPTPKPSVKIDFGAAVQAAPPRPKIDPVVSRAAVEDARQVGFSTRAEPASPVKIDRRTLRRSARTAQLNMKLTPAVRDAFQEASIGFATTEEFIEHLLHLHNVNKRA
jgi:hypothetical protein